MSKCFLCLLGRFCYLSLVCVFEFPVCTVHNACRKKPLFWLQDFISNIQYGFQHMCAVVEYFPHFLIVIWFSNLKFVFVHIIFLRGRMSVTCFFFIWKKNNIMT